MTKEEFIKFLGIGQKKTYAQSVLLMVREYWVWVTLVLTAWVYRWANCACILR
ncbi:unnamed protein product [Spodoptera littoralis]|uniref:Uncharacterized protein n=1 Tax=Spodoptera littoralis TaxID=7109 RepID=A0A9P0N0U0_SPOLI|nr:unnamed protein product [Spodoptera littoralis]